MNLKEFGEYFSEIRKREGYKSQRDLAEKSGVSNATISRLESGTTKPSPEVLRELANCFVNVTYEELMQNAGYMDLLSVIREDGAIYTTDLEKLGSKYESIIDRLKFRKIYVRDNNLLLTLTGKNISITSVSNNLEIGTIELLEILEGKRNITLVDVVKLAKLYKLKCLDNFKLEESQNHSSAEDDSVLINLDKIIQKELIEVVSKYNKNKFTEDIKRNHISEEELEYLAQCLKLYRDLNLVQKPTEMKE